MAVFFNPGYAEPTGSANCVFVFSWYLQIFYTLRFRKIIINVSEVPRLEKKLKNTVYYGMSNNYTTQHCEPFDSMGKTIGWFHPSNWSWTMKERNLAVCCDQAYSSIKNRTKRSDKGMERNFYIKVVLTSTKKEFLSRRQRYNNDRITTDYSMFLLCRNLIWACFLSSDIVQCFFV